MKATFFFGLILLSVSFISCDDEAIRPSGNVETANINIEDFSGLYISHSFEVKVSLSGTENIRINADDNIMPYVEVFKDDQVLAIRLDEDIQLRGNYTLEAEIDAKYLDKFYASGASSITLEDPLDAENIYIELSGASKFTGELNSLNADARLSGASSVSLAGFSELYDVHLSGASTAGGYDFEVDILDADLSGASQCRVTVNDEIRVRASGASTLRYRGNGEVVEQEISGESSVSRD